MNQVFESLTIENIIQIELGQLSQFVETFQNKIKMDFDNLKSNIDCEQNLLQKFVQNFEKEIHQKKDKETKIIINTQKINAQIAHKKQWILVKKRVKFSQEKYLEQIKNQYQNVKLHLLKTKELITNEQVQIAKVEESGFLKNEKQSKPKSPIMIDTENQKLHVSIKKDKKESLYTLKYLIKDDRFIPEENYGQSVTQIASQFNFHRNIGLLYQALKMITP